MFFNLLSCVCVSFSWQSGNSLQQRAEAWRNEVNATRELEVRRPPPVDSFVNSGVRLQHLIVFKEQVNKLACLIRLFTQLQKKSWVCEWLILLNWGGCREKLVYANISYLIYLISYLSQPPFFLLFLEFYLQFIHQGNNRLKLCCDVPSLCVFITRVPSAGS